MVRCLLSMESFYYFHNLSFWFCDSYVFYKYSNLLKAMTFYSPVYLLLCHRFIQCFIIYYHYFFTIILYKIGQDEPLQMSSYVLLPKFQYYLIWVYQYYLKIISQQVVAYTFNFSTLDVDVNRALSSRPALTT